MIEQAIAYIQVAIATHGAWGVFIATILQELIAPIPSALIPLAAGFALIAPDTATHAALAQALFLVAIPVGVGMSLGSLGMYAIAYYGGKPVIDRYGKYLGLSWSEIEKMEKRIETMRGDELALFTLRLIPIIPGIALSGFCGAVRYSMKSFLLTTFLGSAVRAFGLALVGWQVGEVYEEYVAMFGRFEQQILYGVVALVILSLAVWYLTKKVRN